MISKKLKIQILALASFILWGCQSAQKPEPPTVAAVEDPDSSLRSHTHHFEQRHVANASDTRVGYEHRGSYNHNPGTSHGPVAIDVNNKDQFKKDLSSFKDPKAISDNYEYQTNQEDVLARHTFVLAGADRTIGHHIALFESRHQHHAIVTLEFDFSGAGLKPGVVKESELKVGKTLFETKILKEGKAGVEPLPSGASYVVQVSPLNPEFELVTIPTGITRSFLGSFGMVTKEGQVKRITGQGADVVVKIKNIFHFNRLYLRESPQALQYMALSYKDREKPNRYVLAHIVQGTLPNAKSADALNQEQMLEAEVVAPAGAKIETGSIIQIQDRPADSLLKTDDTVEAKIFRSGVNEAVSTSDAPLVKLKIQKQTYRRSLGIDAGQEAVRVRVRKK